MALLTAIKYFIPVISIYHVDSDRRMLPSTPSRSSLADAGMNDARLVKLFWEMLSRRRKPAGSE